MITIKLPYETDNDLSPIKNIIREQTIIKKWSYNRFKDGKSEKEIRLLKNNLNNINNLDSWFVQSSIYDGKQIYLSNKDEKVIFNKSNFIRRQKCLISKDEYKLTNNDYIYSIGEAPKNGNRKFQLNIDNNSVIFKPKREIKIELSLPKLRKNIQKKLIKLDLLSKENKLPITYKLDLKHIYITFDDKIINDNTNKVEYNDNRVLGIDLNPNYIGLSILEFKNNNYEVIRSQCYDISKLTDKYGNHNKLKYETIEITNKIINLANHYKVKHIMIEELNIKSKDNEKGKNYNSLVLNKWIRNLFKEQISKRARNYGINLFTVLPYYSSYIGNLQHDYIDPINSSIEIGRRGYEVIILKNKQFYPEYKIKAELTYQWKEYVNSVVEWKELFKTIKNFKLRYRVSLEDCDRSYNVLRMNSTKSDVNLYIFT